MTRPLAESITSFLLERVIVRTTIKCRMNKRGLTQGQNLCGGDDGVRVCAWVCVGVRGCAYASESVGRVCSQKRERTKSASCVKSKKLEAISERRSGDKKSDRLSQFTK